MSSQASPASASSRSPNGSPRSNRSSSPNGSPRQYSRSRSPTPENNSGRSRSGSPRSPGSRGSRTPSSHSETGNEPVQERKGKYVTIIKDNLISSEANLQQPKNLKLYKVTTYLFGKQISKIRVPKMNEMPKLAQRRKILSFMKQMNQWTPPTSHHKIPLALFVRCQLEATTVK